MKRPLLLLALCASPLVSTVGAMARVQEPDLVDGTLLERVEVDLDAPAPGAQPGPGRGRAASEGPARTHRLRERRAARGRLPAHAGREDRAAAPLRDLQPRRQPELRWTHRLQGDLAVGHRLGRLHRDHEQLPREWPRHRALPPGPGLRDLRQGRGRRRPRGVRRIGGQRRPEPHPGTRATARGRRHAHRHVRLEPRRVDDLPRAGANRPDSRPRSLVPAWPTPSTGSWSARGWSTRSPS